MSTFKPGDKLKKGQYESKETLGAGGFGVTYLADDFKRKTQVAIKTINVQTLQSQYRTKHGSTEGFDGYLQEQQDKFNSEAMVLASFDHPHIVKVYPELFLSEGISCMVMEYVKGKNLESCKYKKGLFSEAEALKIMEEIGSALTYIHQRNYLHRDIKPQNILLREDDGKAILIDFGLAREVNFAELISLTNATTPVFAPPEQFERKGNFTPALDIYALAATLFVLLAVDEPPFIPLPSHYLNAKIMQDLKMSLQVPKDLNPQISQRVSDAILKGMEFDLTKRPQSVKEWLKLLIPGLNESSSIKLITAKADFTRLNDLLKAGSWREANEETRRLMLLIANREKEGWLDKDSCKNFPREELKIIDDLWVKYSDGKFGFSVQKKIWLDCGGIPGLFMFVWDVFKKVGEIIGWRNAQGKWLDSEDFTFNINATVAHLPTTRLWGCDGLVHVWGGLGGMVISLFSSLDSNI